MSLYPSLEDMKIDNMVRAQIAQQSTPAYNENGSLVSNTVGHVYPSLGDYMGLELSSDVIALNMPEYQMQVHQVNI